MFSESEKNIEEVLLQEQLLYIGNDKKRIHQLKESCNRRYVIWLYLVSFRKCQYWKSIRENAKSPYVKRLVAKYLFRYYDKKRNILSERCGVEIGINSHIGMGIDIWHGGIVINGDLGDGCVLHGNNIIGNKGKGRENEFPKIGKHVDIGAGATIIGNVEIADDCIIGAGAVVTKNFKKGGEVLVGVPAREIS